MQFIQFCKYVLLPVHTCIIAFKFVFLRRDSKMHSVFRKFHFDTSYVLSFAFKMALAVDKYTDELVPCDVTQQYIFFLTYVFFPKKRDNVLRDE